jgi:hypothetical protein
MFIPAELTCLQYRVYQPVKRNTLQYCVSLSGLPLQQWDVRYSGDCRWTSHSAPWLGTRRYTGSDQDSSLLGYDTVYTGLCKSTFRKNLQNNLGENSRSHCRGVNSWTPEHEDVPSRGLSDVEQDVRVLNWAFGCWTRHSDVEQKERLPRPGVVWFLPTLLIAFRRQQWLRERGLNVTFMRTLPILLTNNRSFLIHKFFPPTFLSKNRRMFKYRTVDFMYFHMGVMLCLSHEGKDRCWGRSRTGCRGKYVGLRGEWRMLHNAELYDRHASQNVIQPIISNRMRWVGHVARKEGKRNT